ncbi:phosphatidylserine decarboxylase proenzyme [Histoplasma capsulatum var. duboisii H88]|uniref:Phosphatidylserine decarboxylase proenzyme 1, mitochondrial n=1 Tax=Ajellomyces capsulatus (strain H88) TaxID=544711 RepID=F0UFS3_AJEC8|nr:phosphatidylserine decarboxylase proenzyme [Histoplasma capsulatum var. duboisii H88]QSS54960.1 phosphatidylserine decarboxylase proenzyme [Histoplasma capsulatum var. duboisii H88]
MFGGRAAIYRNPARFARTWEVVAAELAPCRASNGITAVSRRRLFSSSSGRWQQNGHGGNGSQGKESFRSRLRIALGNTKIKWHPIPVGLGIGFLGFVQFFRSKKSEKERLEREGSEGKASARRKIRPSGPWQVQVMSTLPLKAMSRLWGRFNELSIPYYLRVPGFKLYSWIFGVNLDEVGEPDLHTYPNLAAFFYRELKPGVRPLDPNPLAILSPSDGRILQFGMIENGEVEQVKGMTYSLDALLGHEEFSPGHEAVHPTKAPIHHSVHHERTSNKVPDNVAADENFAKMNGITYTLPTLLSGKGKGASPGDKPLDASMHSTTSSEAKVKADLAKGKTAWYMPTPTSNKSLFYVVIYLAPGDYHRFHSPVSWVVESRRHFAGELFSVSPYLQRTLPGLFTLNERVVLLGRWRWGFFSMTPVGATNVGSIKINFDSELRTNSLTTDTAADRAASAAAMRGETYSGFSEATYHHASDTLEGHALQRGEEMGGFQLGSSIVLVFEAPLGKRPSFDLGWRGEQREGGWKWKIEKGQYVQYGQAIGEVEHV